MSDFNKVAADWDKNNIHVERSEAIAKKLIPYLGNRNGSIAMEFGAGTGLLSFLLKDKFSRLVLLDTSQEMINIANSKITISGAQNLEAKLIDLEKEEYTGGTFDVIFTQMVMHHVADVDAMLGKFYRLINPGGLLAIADLYAEDGSFHGEGYSGHNGFDPVEFEKKLTLAGFENPSHQTCFIITKEVNNGILKDFPVFLLTAEKK